jgi:hypothetical protein
VFRQPLIYPYPCPARGRIRGLTFALALALAACAAPAQPVSIPTDPPLAASDAGADADADAGQGPLPVDAAVATKATDGQASKTPPTGEDLPAARGPVFVRADGTCWLRERVTCATNTDCTLPPHRQVACPPPAGD